MRADGKIIVADGKTMRADGKIIRALAVLSVHSHIYTFQFILISETSEKL